MVGGANYEKYNSLWDHMTDQEFFVADGTWAHYYNMEVYGMYGPRWNNSFGGGHLKFLRRRSSEPTVYNNKNPILNWYYRKLDERGIHWEFPRGQDYQVFSLFFVFFYFF